MTRQRSRLNHIYNSMKNRCLRPDAMGYSQYGGRGIKVCDEWVSSYHSFRDWAMANGYSDDLTLDRINPDGDYEPINCRWVDMVTQANNKRNNLRVTYKGVTLTAAEWARIFDMKPEVLYKRLKDGWAVEDALTIPKYEYAPRTRGKVEWNGESHTIAEWSRILNMSQTALYMRFKLGWSTERALTTPVGEFRSHRKR